MWKKRYLAASTPPDPDESEEPSRAKGDLPETEEPPPASATEAVAGASGGASMQSRENPIPNPLCEQRTEEEFDLLDRAREEPFVCKGCPKIFSSKKALQFHYKQVSEKGSAHFECRICKAKFDTPFDLKCHETTHNPIEIDALSD